MSTGHPWYRPLLLMEPLACPHTHSIYTIYPLPTGHVHVPGSCPPAADVWPPSMPPPPHALGPLCLGPLCLGFFLPRVMSEWCGRPAFLFFLPFCLLLFSPLPVVRADSLGHRGGLLGECVCTIAHPLRLHTL